MYRQVTIRQSVNPSDSLPLETVASFLGLPLQPRYQIQHFLLFPPDFAYNADNFEIEFQQRHQYVCSNKTSQVNSKILSILLQIPAYRND